MLIKHLSHYQQKKLTAQIQYNVAYNAKCDPASIEIKLERGEHHHPDTLNYIDEDNVDWAEVGIKCDTCGTIYSTTEEFGELCECPNCNRPTYENY